MPTTTDNSATSANEKALDFPELAAAATAVESGAYVYSGSEDAEGISEDWHKYLLADGESLIVSTRRVASAGITLRAQTRHFEDEMCEAWFEFSGPVRVRANYIFGEAGHLLLRHQVGDAPVTEQKFDASSCDLLFPLLRVYTGPMLRAIIEDGGSGTVLIPRIDCIEQPELLLSASFSERAVEVVGPASVEVSGEPTACEQVIFRGGPYVDGAHCCLADDRLLSYEWQQSDNTTWRVQLTA